MYESSALGFSQGGAVDPHSVAVMAQATQQGVNHRPAAEKVLPLFVGEICGNDRGLAPVALLHEFKEDVGLLGLDIDVTQFVYEEHIESHEAVEELARGAVSQGGIHLVEQVLCPNELTTVAILEGLEQDTASESGLTDPSFAYKDDILGFWDELQFSEGTDLAAVDAGLFGIGEGLKGPLFGQACLLDAPLEGVLLAGTFVL